MKHHGNYTEPSERQDNLLLGASALVAEIFMAVLLTAIVKLISDDISVSMILLFRYLFCLPAIFAFGYRRFGWDVFRVSDTPTMVLRSLSGLAGLTTWFTAISLIEITKAVALSQTLAMFITILAPVILGERIGLHRWGAVLVGLCGALILVRPGTEGWLNPGVLLALASTLFAALMFIFLRKLGKTDPPVKTALTYNIFGACVFSVWCLASSQALPTEPFHWWILIGCGLLASVQQMLMALSHALAPASALAPFHYFSVPFAIGFGILIFHEPITLGYVAGTTIIVLSTYYITVRERRSRLP